MIDNFQLSERFKNQDIVDSLCTIRDAAESQLSTMSRMATLERPDRLSLAQDGLAQTLRQTSKMIEMIQYFRDVAHSRPPEAGPGRASIHESVYQVLHAMSYEFPFRNMTVLKILPHSLGHLALEQEHLDTILFQLIYSARMALEGQGAGMITVEAEERLFPTPEEPSRKRFWIRISDTGPQIPRHYLDRLFDPFFDGRIGGGRNSLGLFVARKLIDINRGTIQVESGSHGTNFYLTLPA